MIITLIAFKHEKRKIRVNVLREKIDSIIVKTLIAKFRKISKLIFKEINPKFNNTQKL